MEVINMVANALNKIDFNHNIAYPFNAVELTLNVKEKQLKAEAVDTLLKK